MVEQPRQVLPFRIVMLILILIDRLAAKKGKHRSQIMREILKDYFKDETPISA